MPSQRRLRVLLVAVVAGVILTLFYTSRLRAAQHRGQDFYSRTVSALDSQAGHGRGSPGGQTVLDAKTGKGVGHTPVDHDADGDVDEDDARLAREMGERLKAAEQKAKDLANQKSPLKPDAPSEVIGVGSSAGGQQKKLPAANKAGGDAAKTELPDAPETEEEHEVETELNDILKKSPVIIFSKTYCPFSKRAKGLLLEKYLVEPAPYVVELDKHPLGAKLQALLLRTTGRGTVPNIMVNGVSIGGSDDIAEMDAKKLLVAKIKDLGNRRVDMKERFVESSLH